MGETKKDLTHQERVSVDTLYSEIMKDVREARILEFDTAKWYTTLLTALVGLTATYKTSSLASSGAERVLIGNFWIRPLGAMAVLAIALSSCYTIFYVNKVQTNLEDYASTYLRGEQLPFSYIRGKMPKLRPRHLLMFTQILLAVATAVLIFM